MGGPHDQDIQGRPDAGALATPPTVPTAEQSPLFRRGQRANDEAPTELAVGAEVGRFSLLGKLGAGGMGVVYAAYDPELDRRVAIKLLAYNRDLSRQANLRLLREAQAMARLSHPNVVSIYDVGELEDRLVFLAMEYVSGQTLDAWIAAAPRSWREIRDVLVQAGRGLAAAHQAGLVHRDFKPGNLLVDAAGRTRVADFGIARLDEEDESAAGAPVSHDTPLDIPLTRTGSAIGTPAYMAPEQHRRQVVGPRADQFAFCVTAWEAFFGERPFAGEGPELLRAIAEGAVSAPDGAREVPSWIAPVLRRGLADQPDERWPSIDVLVDRLADDPDARRRRRLALAASLVGVAALAAGGSWLAFRETPGELPDPTAACRDRGDDFTGIWDDATRRSSEQAFAASGSALGRRNWTTVADKVQTWATRWSEARRDACAAHALGRDPTELYRRRNACLDRQRDLLRAFSQIMHEPDSVIVRESVMAVAMLPNPAHCWKDAVLLAQAPPPDDPTAAEAVATTRRESVRAKALRTFGRYAEALAAARAVQEPAGRLDTSLHAEITYQIGQLQSDVREPGAEQTLRSAATLASAAGDLPLYARIRASLVFDVGAKQARFEDAAPLRVLAREALGLAGGDPAIAVEFHRSEGAVDYIHGDHAAAATSLEQGLALEEKLWGADHLQITATLNILANVRGALGQQEVSEKLYRRALAIFEAAGAAEHPRAASLLSNLAGIFRSRGRFAEAIDYDRRSLALLEAALGPDHVELAPTLNNLAQPLWTLGRYDEAFAAQERARLLWEGKLGGDHPYVGVALMNLGGLRQEQGRCAEALAYLERALPLAEKMGPDHEYVAAALTYMGASRIDCGQAAVALPLLVRAEKIRAGGSSRSDLAGARFELARALWATGRDRRRALAMAAEAQRVLAADDQDRAQIAAGVPSSSQRIAAWLQGKAAL